jgi:hypothetical protein
MPVGCRPETWLLVELWADMTSTPLGFFSCPQMALSDLCRKSLAAALAIANW